MKDILAIVNVATGRKCRRCSKIFGGVGWFPQYRDLCDRCGEAVIEYDKWHCIEIKKVPLITELNGFLPSNKWERTEKYLIREVKELKVREVYELEDLIVQEGCSKTFWEIQEPYSTAYWNSVGLERN